MNYRLLYEHPLYQDDLKYITGLDLPWKKLENKTIMLSGGTGLIGSFLIDALMKLNQEGLECHIYILSRNMMDARERFAMWKDSTFITFLECDVNKEIAKHSMDSSDYILHLASNTHPLQYSLDPIGTIATNIFGLKNMLDFAVEMQAERFLFASSNEVYGENRGDVDTFNELYCGYINCNTLRAGYPESKRCGEAMCQAYASQQNLEVVIPRFTRSYGPTMRLNDSKALSQFIKKGLAKKNIVLKSSGSQLYSFTYVADAVSGLLTVLLKGTSGEAYNIADSSDALTLKEIAAIVADYSGKELIFEQPDSVEEAGYSVATKAILNNEKISQLNWKAHYNLQQGIERTLEMLNACSF